MKTIMRLFLLCLSFCSSLHLYAQEQYLENPIIFDPFVSDESFIKNFPIPVVRPVKTGTKIIPVFSGNWNYEAEGAFRFACKIWEESIPTTYPIVINAIMDTTTPASQYSQVSSNAYLHNEPGVNRGQYMTSLLVQAKATTYGEATEQYYRETEELQLDSVMFFTPEMDITYYNYGGQIDNYCSFSLEGNTDSSHYDFVTMALRDIGKGLGITCSFKGARNNQTGTRFLRADKSTITPYEEEVLYALGFNADSCTWYNNATQGSINVCGYSIYAPTTWDRSRSLNYFVPNNNEKITQLLDYNFGKGSVVREIDDNNLQQKLFKNLLKWRGFLPVGMQGDLNGMTEIATSTNDDIPYNADTLFVWEGISRGSNDGNRVVLKNRVRESQEYTEYQASTMAEYKKQFLPNYEPQTGTLSQEGYFVSVMKEDGTWDQIFSWPYINSPVEVYSSDITFHYNMEAYARTLDGKLRGRTVVYSANPSNRMCRVRYYHLNKLPKKVRMQAPRIVNADDDYYRDVKIGLKNLEGVTRVVISQWDEGETFPFVWDETDYDQGYFIATVDKELYTQFEIRAYNQNGYTVTDTIVAPLEPAGLLGMQFIYRGEDICVIPASPRYSNKSVIESYDIKPLTNYAVSTKYAKNCTFLHDGNSINIKGLPKGLYVLSVFDTRGGRHEFKFKK